MLTCEVLVTVAASKAVVTDSIARALTGAGGQLTELPPPSLPTQTAAVLTHAIPRTVVHTLIVNPGTRSKFTGTNYRFIELFVQWSMTLPHC